MTLEKEYAQALLTVTRSRSEAGKRTLLPRLREILKRRGHEKLLPRIFAEYEKLLERQTKRGVKVSFARERDRTQALKAAKEFAAEKITEMELCLEPALVSGFIISGANTRYDASGKRALLELYRQLIARAQNV